MLATDSPDTIIIGLEHIRPGDIWQAHCSKCNRNTPHVYRPGTARPTECMICYPPKEATK